MPETHFPFSVLLHPNAQHNMMDFVAIFAGLGLVTSDVDPDYASAIALVSGIFLGSGIWWLTLSGVVSILREKFNAQKLIWANRGAGVILAGYGIVTLISVLNTSA